MSSGRQSPVSLVDVARRANVSIATASRVASGSSYPVATGTRARVEQAIRELEYSPNALARALARNVSPLIGVVVGAITDPYSAQVARGIESFARGAGYVTVLCNADRDVATELKYLQMLREQRAAGLILTGGAVVSKAREGGFHRAVAKSIQQGMRVVCLANRDLPDAYRVLVDNHRMVFDLTQRLIELGHERITFLATPKGFSSGDERLRGFQDAMVSNGLNPNHVYHGGFDFAWGRRAAEHMLRGTLPEAIVAFNDESALGALMSLRERGVAVPGDVSVAGVDDTRDSRLVGLTSASVPMHEMGAMAARIVIEVGESWPSDPIVLPHRIALRASTARRTR